MKKSKVSRELKNLKPREDPPPGSDDEDSVYTSTVEDVVYPERDYTNAFRLETLECAQIALDYYNKKNRTNYELVEATEIHSFDCVPIWIHLNFTAKPKETSDGDGSASTKLFFAELELTVKLNCFVSACRILRGKSGCCDFCPKDSVKHPTHGYRIRQKFHHNHYDLRPSGRAFKNIVAGK